ncbi:MAG: type II toxin-antitoxin system mRNA interferase toxin, RelE/StbE family [bacterium]|nr:type II toxin-antitoxin system mRNA interferase toxin, RelE/StbE family [bacterium]
MLTLKAASTFLKDLKRAARRGKDIGKLERIVERLQRQKALPEACHDHKLSGEWSNHRECHIEPDWLLIYRVSREDLILERTGSHSDLFE